jgi:hypothetical protein
MLIGTHILIGGVVGAMTGDPLAGLGVGFASHFALDAVPHFDLAEDENITPRKIILAFGEFVLLVGLILYFIKPEISLSGPWLWGAFGSMIPDLLDNVPRIGDAFHRTKFGKKFKALHWYLHSSEKRFWIQIVCQVILIFVFLMIGARYK